MTTQRSRRLRKKLFLDEFAILGFEFSCCIEVKEKEFDELLDGFLDLIESRNLCFGGGGDLNTFSGLVCSNERYASASSDDQLALRDWLTKLDSVTNVKVGTLVDANYGI